MPDIKNEKSAHDQNAHIQPVQHVGLISIGSLKSCSAEYNFLSLVWGINNLISGLVQNDACIPKLPCRRGATFQGTCT